MIRARGAAAAVEQLDAIADAITGSMAAAMAQEAGMLAEEAKRRCPVETGMLRDSIHTHEQVQGARAAFAVGSDLPYAAGVELGTLGHSPQPYLAPALRAREAGLTGHMERIVHDAVRGVK